MNKNFIYLVFVMMCSAIFILNIFVGVYLWNSTLIHRITYEIYILESYFVLTNFLLCLVSYVILKQIITEYYDNYVEFVTYNPHISGLFVFLLMLTAFSIYLGFFQLSDCRSCIVQ
jgi:hypothetical protein